MTTLTALPNAPSRADPTNFSARGDAMMTALEEVFVPEVNIVIGEINAKVVEAQSKVVLATAQAVLAASYVNDAATQVNLASEQVAEAYGYSQTASANAIIAQNAAASVGVVVWVSGTTYSTGDLRYSPVSFQTYRRKTAGAGTTDPSLDATNWQNSLLPSAVGNNTKIMGNDGVTPKWVSTYTFATYSEMVM